MVYTTNNDVPSIFSALGRTMAENKYKYRRYKTPTTIKLPHTKSLNQAIFISESAAMTCLQTV